MSAEREVILNVHASRQARCKIIIVLCVLAIRCRDLCPLSAVRLFVSILEVSIGFLKASVVLRKRGHFIWGFW